MNSLPVLLKNPVILLIGAGNVGLEKARVLFKNNIKFHTISREFHTDFSFPKSSQTKKALEESDIADFKIIIDATGNQDVKNLLLKLKKSNYFLLNVVDDPKYCDFYFSALVSKGPLKIAISTDGASPALAKAVRDEIDFLLPDSLEKLASLKAKQRIKGLIDPQKNIQDIQSKMHQVSLIGCGIGDPELLTLKAYKEIHRGDVVLYDHLVSDEILDLSNANAKRIFVGKKKGFHSISQERINELLAWFHKKGKKVIRLKSGDPYIFGRGAEEALFLLQKKIPFQIINGISSAFAGPSMAGIPITARGSSAGFSVVSAHLKNNDIYLDWIPLLKMPNHTVIVLMGLSLSEQIMNDALKNDVDPKLSVALISNASRDNQKVIFTKLEFLAKEALNVVSPAIIVFGGGVDFAIKNHFSDYL